MIFTLTCMSFLNSFNKVSLNTEIKRSVENTKEIQVQDVYENSNILPLNVAIDNNIDNSNNNNPNEWKIEIPKIGLIANISEGTSKELLDEFVGHFENTEKVNGNIGLAAHNRGYKVNYFGKIKELSIGDEIYYKYGDLNKKYKVSLITIIKDTEWTYLENTLDNRITLITCLEDEPEYRRCIQGVEF